MSAQIRLAQTFLEIGRLDEAQPLLDHAVQHVTPEGAPRFRAIALEALGQLHGARQQPEAAAPLIAEAQELWQALSASAGGQQCHGLSDISPGGSCSPMR